MAEQNSLTDVQGNPLAPIHDAAARYKTHRDRRIAAGTEEKESKENLLAVMKKFEKTYCVVGGLEVTVSETETVKVSKAGKEADPTGDDPSLFDGNEPEVPGDEDEEE